MRCSLALNLVLLQYYACASNVLIWSPTIGHSHVRFLGNIADVLTADGHNVTIFSPTLDPDVTTFGNRLPARTIRFSARKDNDDYRNVEMKSPSLWDSPPCDGVCFRWSDINLIAEKNLNNCKDLLEDVEKINALKETKFELAYTEGFDLCSPGIFQILGIEKMVVVSALGVTTRMYDIVGMRELPSFMPENLTPYSDDMTFLERLTNFKVNIQLNLNKQQWDHVFWELFNSKYPGFPTIPEIFNKKTCLLMTNVNEFAETPRPTANMIRYVGGSTLHGSKALTENLDNLLNERDATVLFSMGSIAQSKDMPERLKNDIIDTFASFPNVTFIWKYEIDDTHMFDAHPNIHSMKWVPQMDLLADKRLSLFITHGGMNSLLEAMFYGKPMVVIPLFGDQQLNAKTVLRIGTGILVEKNNLNKKTLTEAIQRTLGNKKTAQEAAFVASVLTGRPQQYRDDIAKWAKFVIEHGKMNHLLLHSRNLNLMQYYCLDILAFFSSIIIIVVFIFLRLVKWMFSNFRTVKNKRD